MSKNYLSNKCPKCDKGDIFETLIKMNDKCPECGFVLNPGSGYHSASMMLTYIFSGILSLPVFGFLLLTGANFFLVIAIPGILMVALWPFNFRYSRLLWIHMDKGLMELDENQDIKL